MGTCVVAQGANPKIVAASGQADLSSVNPSRGLASAGSLAVAFDAHRGSVFLASPSGAIRWIGQGAPNRGNFAPLGTAFYVASAGPYVDWVHRAGDSLAVLDGARVQLFLQDGKRGEDLATLAGVVPEGFVGIATRVRVVSGGVLLGVHLLGRSTRQPVRRFELWHLGSTEARGVFQMNLAALPKGAEGGWFLGPDEARPVWDAAGDCFFVSDGHSDRILVGTLAQGVQDSIWVPLAGERPMQEPRRGTVALTQSKDIQPQPAMRRRLVEMTLAPRGELWLVPVRASTTDRRTTILQVDLRSKRVRTERVNVFPRAFLDDHSWAGVRRGEDGSLQIAFDRVVRDTELPE